MTQRSEAILILRRARDILTQRLADRVAEAADEILEDAEGIRYVGGIDEIYEQIMSEGWNAERGAFVQHYGSDALDAANLMMPLVFFVSPVEPRMLKTLDATCQLPRAGGLVSNSLVYRYNLGSTVDGLKGEEGSFNICTFWLVEAQTRAGLSDPLRLADARLMYERMLGYANHLGLYAEEIGPRGEALGNFPQAFTHLALISAAYNLDLALGETGA